MVVRSQETRRNARDERVRNYFYGMKLNFYPHIFEVRFADIKIFKIGGKFNICLNLSSKNNKFSCNVIALNEVEIYFTADELKTNHAHCENHQIYVQPVGKHPV